MDCRYCHTSVETTAKANIPPTATCMNCHAYIKTESPKLELVRASAESGEPIAWVRVHDLPDFVFFNHAGHIQSGVGCVSCHGRVDNMEVVEQTEPLNMGWCLSCHRDPESHLRPKEFVTDMQWKAPGDPVVFGAELRKVLSHDPTRIDDLESQSGLTIDQLSSMLLILELHGEIEALSGGRYVLIA